MRKKNSNKGSLLDYLQDTDNIISIPLLVFCVFLYFYEFMKIKGMNREYFLPILYLCLFVWGGLVVWFGVVGWLKFVATGLLFVFFVFGCVGFCLGVKEICLVDIYDKNKKNTKAKEGKKFEK